MKILLTGGTGYIGKRLLPLLLQSGHQVICTVRDKNRFNVPLSFVDNIKVIETDFADVSSVNAIPSDVDVAYYLIHSMKKITRPWKKIVPKIFGMLLKKQV